MATSHRTCSKRPHQVKIGSPIRGVPRRFRVPDEKALVDFERRVVRRDGYIYLVLTFPRPVAVTDLVPEIQDGLHQPIMPRTPQELLYVLKTNFRQSRSDVIVFSASSPLNEAWLPLGPRGGVYHLSATFHLAQGTGPEHRGDLVVRLGGAAPEPEEYHPPELLAHFLELSQTVVEVCGPKEKNLLVDSANLFFPLLTCGTTELRWTLGDQLNGILATSGEGWSHQRLPLPATRGKLPLAIQAGGSEVGNWVLDFDAQPLVHWVTAGRHLALTCSSTDGSPLAGTPPHPDGLEVAPGLYELPLHSTVKGHGKLSPPLLHQVDVVYVALDRGVYQPGEEIVCFGYYRILDGFQRKLCLSQERQIRLKAPGLEQEVHLSPLGAFSVRWRLPEELPATKVQVQIGHGCCIPLRMRPHPNPDVALRLWAKPGLARLAVTGPHVVSLEWRVYAHSSRPPAWSNFQFGGKREKSYAAFAPLDHAGRAELALDSFALEHHWLSGTVEALVQHRTGRAIIRSRPLVWPATAPCVGIRLRRPWTRPDHPAQIELIVCGSQGQLCPDQCVELSWTGETSFATVISRSEPCLLEVLPPSHNAVLQARAGGSLAELSIALSQSFQLHCHQQNCSPGDQICLEVTSPLEDAEGLLIYYWGLQMQAHRFRLHHGSARLDLTVEEGMEPKLWVSAEIVDRQSLCSAPTSVAVNPRTWRLDVHLVLPEHAPAGSELPVAVQVREHSGQVCPEAEVLLLLLDQESVNRDNHRFEDPLDELYNQGPPDGILRAQNLDRFIPHEVALEADHVFRRMSCDGWGPAPDSGEPQPQSGPPAALACLQLVSGPDGVAQGKLALPLAPGEYRLTAFAACGTGHFGVAEVALQLTL